MTHAEKERLYLALLPRIRAAASVTARRFGGNRDDLIQEACLSAWRAMDEFDPSLGYELWTFLASCIRFRLLSIWNSARAKSRQFVLMPFAAGADATDHRRNDREADFDDLLSPCQPRERDVLTLLYRDGFTQEELGNREGVSHQCVSQIARRGLMRIRAKEHRRELRWARRKGE